MTLIIEVEDQEWFDEENERFITLKGQTLVLEHSLVSLSKWESRWHVAFIGNENRTPEQIVDYIRCMTINKVEDPTLYDRLPIQSINRIKAYLEDPMTATKFVDSREKRSSEIITSEIIYYWMISLGVPVEFQKWHLNRLLTLLRVCGVKNSPDKKMPQKEIYEWQTRLNEERLAKFNTTG